jgi:hypothetical protein
MDVKTFYGKLRDSRWSTHNNYLYSPIVYYDMDGKTVPMKPVFVTKKSIKGLIWF